MLNFIIKTALNFRLVVIAVAIGWAAYGLYSARRTSIDVLPDITRPRVAIITECPGVAPEEVESLVTLPLETALSGATGVDAIRSSSDIGLSVIQVEFDWSEDVYRARQVVLERLSTVQTPYEPKLAPISTLLGQIMLVGMWSDSGETSPVELRTLADWTIRRRLMQLDGIAQVVTMGGRKKQFQVLIDPHLLHRYEVDIADVERALASSNLNVAGGYVEDAGRELLIRGIGRVSTVEQLAKTVVKAQKARPVLVEDIARVQIGSQFRRGDASVNGRDAVVLTITKQPHADTRRLTDEINAALEDLRIALPQDVNLQTTYEQRAFIDYSVGNVVEAIRDGSILVVLVLFLFLLNLRTTFITLTAIPLSVLTTFLVFDWMGMTINVMTLGGIAVALGELVDDAIVDVENIFKRLQQNRQSESPQPVLSVIFSASSEVRGAIINSTIIVILVFLPLFFLTGVEGRLFTPLGVAYIVSILASTVVSLTVTPVLSYYLLPASSRRRTRSDSWLLRILKRLATPIIRLSMHPLGFITVCMITLLLAGFGSLAAWRIGKDFLPPFDEGASQLNLFLPAGASLENSKLISELADRRLKTQLQSSENLQGPIQWYTCKNGRAEDDEHVMGVNVTEYTLSLNPANKRSQDEMVELLTELADDIPGVEVEVEQPIAHLISHMLSGVNAEIGIKIYGDDLSMLRRIAGQVKAAIEPIPGLTEPLVEQQELVRQMRVECDVDLLARYGLTSSQINRMIETAMQGRTVSQILVEQATFDLLVRFDDSFREDLDLLKRLPVELPDGKRIPLDDVCKIYFANGPNTINRENSQRRIIVRVNTLNRDLSSAVSEIKTALRQIDTPDGYYWEIGGQFEAQQQATRNMLLFGLLALIGIAVVLFVNFRSLSLVAQIVVAVPIGFIGGMFGLLATGQTLSVAAAVGFISLGGIAIRNGILLIEAFQRAESNAIRSTDTILAGSLERLAPVLMTTMTTGIGLLPLVVGGTLPGKEIIYPVATVILGGLISSTMAEYLLRPGLYWFSRSKPASESVEVE